MIAPAPLRIAGGTLAISIVPDRGGRIASLLHRSSGREWLAAAPEASRPPPGRDTRFVDADMCGWDEMVPTIDPSPSPLPGAAELPDHGDAWRWAWEVLEVTPRRVAMAVDGRCLPYRLWRSIEIVDGAHGELRFEYSLTNRAPDALPLLWAAHPQFAVAPGTRVVLEEDVRRVLDVTPAGGPVPRVWPDGLDTVGALAEGGARKLYLDPDAAPNWVGLEDPKGTWLRLSFRLEEVPYLGLWFDRCAFARRPVIALEPTTGFYDHLTRAADGGRVPVVAGGATTRWALTVEVGEGAPPWG